MLQKIRNKSFWFVDLLTGSKKKSNFEDIKTILTDGSSDESKKRKQQYLEKILSHAIHTVPFYRDKNPQLTSFPVINKNLIRKKKSEFESTAYIDKEKITVCTSGSTGTPFKVCQNKNKRIRTVADNLFFWQKASFSVGDKLYFFRLWNAFEKKNFLTRFTQNVVPIDVFELSDDFIAALLKDIQKRKKKPSLLGYVSAFTKICKYLDRTDTGFKSNDVKSIITISEKLDAYTKKSITKYFGIHAISRYSNLENGIIAQQPAGESYFIINHASYHVEILDIDTDQPVEKGTIGRIIVTDFFNYCMPMIRYDTGDLGSIDTVQGKEVLTHIEGRKIDTIKNTRGEIIIFNVVLIVNKYQELKQCQLIQRDTKEYVFKLNSETTFLREEEFLIEFRSYLGDDAVLSIEYVDEIPLLASGKRRMVVNEMEQSKNMKVLNY